MKMTKKIALVTMFAVLACGSVFAKGKKDTKIREGATVIEDTTPDTSTGPTKNTK